MAFHLFSLTVIDSITADGIFSLYIAFYSAKEYPVKVSHMYNQCRTSKLSRLASDQDKGYYNGYEAGDNDSQQEKIVSNTVITQKPVISYYLPQLCEEYSVSGMVAYRV